MTKEEILAMEAGEEIDDLIAAKIMNWNVKSKLFGEEYEDYWHDGKKFVFECARFNPSTDLSAAWEVLEKFEEYDIRKYVSAANEFMYECVITIKDVSLSHIHKNAPLAICKAALLAAMKS